MTNLHNAAWASHPALTPWLPPATEQPAPPNLAWPATPFPADNAEPEAASAHLTTAPTRPKSSPTPGGPRLINHQLRPRPSVRTQTGLNTTPNNTPPAPASPPPTERIQTPQTASPVVRPPAMTGQSLQPPGLSQTPFAISDPITRRRARPTRGWRALLYSASGGLCNPGLSRTETERRRLIDQVGTHLSGLRQIAVTSLKGGIGKTTVTACLGLTLAEHRGDRIIALDANPDAGTLADRLTGHVGITIRDVIDNIDSIHSWTDLAHYTSLAGRLQVLASEQDPEMSEAFNRDEYDAVVTKLAEFNNVILTDCGTGLRGPDMAVVR